MNNYRLYKLTVKVKSPLVTYPKGDMLWGFIASYLSQKEDQTDFLNFTDLKMPSLILSSAFPYGKIPSPLREIKAFSTNLSKQEYTENKNKKKQKYEDANKYLEFEDEIEEIKEESSLVNSYSMHTSISRNSNTVIEGSLYSINEIWVKGDKLDIYAFSYLEKDVIKGFFNKAFELGFGQKASTGYGVMEVESITLVKKEKYKGSGFYLCLAPFVLSKEQEKNINDLKANIFTRFGKRGINSGNVFKIPVVFYDEGATFEMSKENKGCIGEILDNMSSDKDINVMVSGLSPIIEVSLKEVNSDNGNK